MCQEAKRSKFARLIFCLNEKKLEKCDMGRKVHSVWYLHHQKLGEQPFSSFFLGGGGILFNLVHKNTG